eukprot:8976982-Alexandrium_andersonii.AAC.1
MEAHMHPAQMDGMEARLAEWPYELPMPTGGPFAQPVVFRPDYLLEPEVEVIAEVPYGFGPLGGYVAVSYTHLRAHETSAHL